MFEWWQVNYTLRCMCNVMPMASFEVQFQQTLRATEDNNENLIWIVSLGQDSNRATKQKIDALPLGPYSPVLSFWKDDSRSAGFRIAITVLTGHHQWATLSNVNPTHAVTRSWHNGSYICASQLGKDSCDNVMLLSPPPPKKKKQVFLKLTTAKRST